MTIPTGHRTKIELTKDVIIIIIIIIIIIFMIIIIIIIIINNVNYRQRIIAITCRASSRRLT